MFRGDVSSSGSDLKEVSRENVLKILKEAEDKHLVCRPFRNDIDRSLTERICFYCDDCCAYFTKPDDICNKGKYIEKTKMDFCTNCGFCEEICFFGARKIIGDRLSIDSNERYGCALCIDVCPEECIEVVLSN